MPTGHSLSAPPSDDSVEPSGLYPELVGCLMSYAAVRPADRLGKAASFVSSSIEGLGFKSQCVHFGHPSASQLSNMADTEEVQPKKRTFKKFTFRGIDLDALLDMGNEELVNLFTARARRRYGSRVLVTVFARKLV
ncbi:unnamed protein product [Closterium sp. NIES-54]